MRLKIGLLNDSFPPTIDGVANATLNYASVIHKKYGEPIVITPEYPNIIDDYPFEVYRYSSLKLRSQMPYRIGNPFSPITIGELHKKNMDLMHVHCPFASAVLARQINNSYVKSKRIPIVFTYHTKFDIDIDKFVVNKKLNKIARKFLINNISAADEVWAVSNGAGENLRSLGYNGDIRVMPNGTDFKKEKAPKEEIDRIKDIYRLRANVPTFLFVGRMMWYKNPKLILDSLSILKKNGIDFQCLFVGDGTDRPAIEHYAKQIGVNDNTIFTGAVYDREKVRAFFCCADLFLFPSTYDTSGLVVREAAACDCASLLIKGSCAAEGVENGVSGVFAEENAESCAKALSEVIKHKGAFERLGKAAAEKVYYSWEQAVDCAYKRYEEIIERR